MNSKIRSFRDLRVWQRGIELVKEIYKITKSFPKEELYALTAQMRRASISIPSNLAEGFRRKHNKEYKQFLNIVLGSSAELETQIVIAHQLHYIDSNKEKEITEIINHICGMIVNLMKKL